MAPDATYFQPIDALLRYLCRARSERRPALSSIFPGFGSGAEAQSALSRETAVMRAPPAAAAPGEAGEEAGGELLRARSSAGSADLDAMEVAKVIATSPRDQAAQEAAPQLPPPQQGVAPGAASPASATETEEDEAADEEGGTAPSDLGRSATRTWPRAVAQGPEERPSLLAAFPDAGSTPAAGPARPPKVPSLAAIPANPLAPLSMPYSAWLSGALCA